MKELIRFRQFLAEGQINENVSPEALIKVYQGEIASLIASGEKDVVPVLNYGIEMLKAGVPVEQVNVRTAKEVAQIQGEFDWDEFARIYMDKAQEVGQIQGEFDSQDLRTLERIADDLLTQGDEGPAPKAGDVLTYDWTDDNREIQGEIPGEFMTFDEDEIGKYEVKKVGEHEYEFKITAKVDVDTL